MPDAIQGGHASDRRVAVVVLTFDDREQTLACLAALQPELTAADAVFVADNGSTDGTEAAVRARFPAVHYVRNGGNLGFAGGCNAGIQAAIAHGYRYVFLLNNDARLTPGALETLVAHAEAEPSLGAAQPVLAALDDPTRIDSLGIGLSRWPGVFDRERGGPAARAPSAPTAVFGACGAAVLLRTAALARAGAFDDRLFILLEDVELMFRLRLDGWHVALVPGAVVHHARRVSAGARGPHARRRRFWLQRNMVALALRYWPGHALVLAAPLLAYRALDALRLRRAVPDQPCTALWRAFLAQRRETRVRMRRLGMDAWFGRRPRTATLRQ